MTAPTVEQRRAGEIACDEGLFNRLRGLRKRLADERGVPPYIVFSDVALREMARQYPEDRTAFATISGVGSQKLREFAEAFLDEIRSHVREHGKQEFASEPAVPVMDPPLRSKLTDTVTGTLSHFRAGQSVAEIARTRQMTESTIFGHLAIALECGEAVDISPYVDAVSQAEIEAAFRKHGLVSTGRVHAALHGKHDYGPLKLVRAKLIAQGWTGRQG